MIALRGILRVAAGVAAAGLLMGTGVYGQAAKPRVEKGSAAGDAKDVAASKAESAPVVVTNLCSPKVVLDKEVASAEQRKLAGQLAWPPLTDLANGFAWPDTPLGVVAGDGGYVFFGSDGAFHARQMFEGLEFGNNKYGSITRTIGTLDNPLGSEPPIDVTVQANRDPGVNPYYASYDYMGGGPVWKIPAGMKGAGNLLMVYHAEIPTVQTQSFDSVYALAESTNGGMSWEDLGEIVRINQGYRTDMDGFDIGDAPLVVSPDGKYLQIYFMDWLANGSTHWNNTLTHVSMARASIAEVVELASGAHPRAAAFTKYYQGFDLNQGLGGYSQDLHPNDDWGVGGGELQVAYNSYLGRYQMIVGGGSIVGYAESPDGLHWSAATVLDDLTNAPGMPTGYFAPVGMGADPMILGKEFYIFNTRYPQDGTGWDGATVHRLTVSCK